MPNFRTGALMAVIKHSGGSFDAGSVIAARWMDISHHTAGRLGNTIQIEVQCAIRVAAVDGG